MFSKVAARALCAALMSLAVVPAAAHAQAPGVGLVKQIGASTGSSAPGAAAKAGDTVFFGASDGSGARGLWKLDEESACVVAVKVADLPGQDDPSDGPKELTALGDLLLFVTRDDDGAYQVWASDGTEAGTEPITNFAPGQDLRPSDLIEVGELAYFAVTDDNDERTLWVTDGTSAGTDELVPLPQASDGDGPPTALGAVLDGELYFGAEDPDTGDSGLFRTAGAADPVLAVPFGSARAGVTRAGDTLFFTSPDGELWASDGTEAGSVSLNGSEDPEAEFTEIGDPLIVGAVGDTMYVAGENDDGDMALFKSDGTPEGTVEVTDLPGFEITLAASTADRLFFVARNHNDGSTGLLVSDGTEAGTGFVAQPDGEEDGPRELITAGDTAYYDLVDLDSGREVWKSDGTPAGTMLVRDVMKGEFSSDPLSLAAVDGQVMFAADNGFFGSELWTTDGTAAGAHLVADVNRRSHGRDARVLGTLGQNVLFSAGSPTRGQELWSSDGTAAGTVRVKDIRPGVGGSFPGTVFTDGSTVYFSADDGEHGFELWKTDGTRAGTTLVKDARPGEEGAFNSVLGTVGGKLIVALDDDGNGPRVWATDGTEAGTVRLSDDVRAESSGSGRGDAAVTGGYLYFSGQDEKGREPWKTDGTPAGTTRVANLRHQDWDSFPSNFAVLGSTVYFAAAGDLDEDGDADDGGDDQVDDSSGIELWKTDGTAAGTELVSDLRPGQLSGDPRYLTELDGKLYFQSNATGDQELWATDGTGPGTAMVKDIEPGDDSSPEGLTVWNGELYFSAVDHAHGRELWKSDGTEAGTVLVKDLVSGPAFSGPQSLIEHDGELWVNASWGSDGPHALWRTDGTPTGTVLVHQFAAESQAGRLASAGGELFLAASDGVRGRDLWSTAAAATDPGAGPAPGDNTGCAPAEPTTDPDPDPAPDPDPDPDPDPGTGGGGDQTGGSGNNGGGSGNNGGGSGNNGGGGGSNPPSGSNPPTGSNPPVGPSDADIRKMLGTLGSFKVKGSNVTFTQTFLVPGSASWKVTMSVPSGSGKAVAAKTVTLGTGKKKITKSGKLKVTVKLTRKGRALLKKTRKPRLKVTTKLVTASGRTVTVTTNKRGR